MHTRAHVLLDVAVASTPDVSALSSLTPTLAYLGYTDQAATHAEQAVLKAKQLGPIPLVLTLHHSVRTALARRDDAWCHEAAEMQMAIAEEQGLLPFLANARCYLGWLKAKQGNTREGLILVTEGTAMLASLGYNLTSLFNCLMSDALAWSGRQSDAVAVLDETLALSARTGAGWLDAELHRRKAVPVDHRLGVECNGGGRTIPRGYRHRARPGSKTFRASGWHRPCQALVWRWARG